MKRLAVWLCLVPCLLLCAIAAAADSDDLLRFTPLSGRTEFVQLKQLQGLPLPLRSSGYLQLQADTLLWHTTAPVDSKLLISAAGVSQWQQQQYVALAGSEFVGQLMLAVLQQQHSFIAAHFELSKGDANCTLLQPLQPPLNQLFQHITLCGEQSLDSLTLTELNSNLTRISLQAAQEPQ
jgi:hypothetical protein